jgi:hypothetical protein
VLGLLQANVPGVQSKGRAIEDGTGVDVGDVVGVVVREEIMVVNVVGVVGKVGGVVERVDVAGRVGNDAEVVVMNMGVVVKRSVTLPVSVSIVPFVSEDPVVVVAFVGPAVVEELLKGKGGVNVGMLVVVGPENPVPVADVVTAEPSHTRPWPDSRGTVS